MAYRVLGFPRDSPVRAAGVHGHSHGEGQARISDQIPRTPQDIFPTGGSNLAASLDSPGTLRQTDCPVERRAYTGVAIQQAGRGSGQGLGFPRDSPVDRHTASRAQIAFRKLNRKGICHVYYVVSAVLNFSL